MVESNWQVLYHFLVFLVFLGINRPILDPIVVGEGIIDEIHPVMKKKLCINNDTRMKLGPQ